MYINIYGCDDYMNVYRCVSANPGECDNEPPMYWCAHAKAQPIFSSVYWVTFVVVAALVMLSLFIGAVTMSMSSSMEDMKKEASFTKSPLNACLTSTTNKLTFHSNSISNSRRKKTRGRLAC